MSSIAASTSSSVVYLVRLKRRLAFARSFGNPMAVRTWEGSAAPEAQAEPPEMARPFEVEGDEEGFSVKAIEPEVGGVGDAGRVPGR